MNLYCNDIKNDCYFCQIETCFQLRKKIIISLFCLNIIVLLSWGGMQLSAFVKKQRAKADAIATLSHHDAKMGIMSKNESETLWQIGYRASDNKSISDEDLDWAIALFERKWMGTQTSDSIARWEIVNVLGGVKRYTDTQQRKLSALGLSLNSPSISEFEPMRKMQFARFGLVTRDERFIPTIIGFTHDKDTDVQKDAKSILKKLGVSTGDRDKTPQ